MSAKKSLFPESNPKTVKYIEVPEIEDHDEESVTRLINSCFLRRGRSFGAFVLRSVSFEDMGKIEESFRDNPILCSDRSYRNRDFSRDISNLHSDAGPERDPSNNDVTLHFTFNGSADFILLAGSTLFKPEQALMPRSPTLLRHNNEMFDAEEFTPVLASVPEIAYKTEINAGDLLIFDHTQPHAFRSSYGVSQRTSIAHYFTP